MRDLRNFECPIKKIKQIQEARDLIPICINEFWRGLDVPSDSLVLDADQMLSIMTYSISKSSMTDLHCHIKLIEEFTSTEIQNGKVGQALFTLRAAAENLTNSMHLRRESISKFGLRNFSKGSIGGSKFGLFARMPSG